jgi:hypothetical protein
MNLTQADRALAAGFAGQLESPQKRQYVVTVIRGGQRHQEVAAYASRADAEQAGLNLLGTFHGVVSVRPLVELTEEEGARRFPHPLHKDAFTDAWRGWHERAARDFQPEPSDAARMLHDYDYAMVAQLSRPDAIEQAHRAAQVAM